MFIAFHFPMRSRMNHRGIFFSIIPLLGSMFVNAADIVKPKNPNRVADFSDIEARIYRLETLENFEEKSIEDIFLPQENAVTVKVLSELTPPVTESNRYLSVSIPEPEMRRVRLQFKNPPEIKGYCRAFSFWLNVEKLHARLALIVEDREGSRHFLDSGELQFRGWRRMRLSVPQKVHQQDWYLKEGAPLKLIGIEVVFAKKYTKGKLPLILLDEISAEVRDKYQLPPPLKKTP